MNSDWIEGIGHQAKGAFKRAFGRTIGDATTTADGAGEKAIGDAQVAAVAPSGRIMGIDADRITGVAHQLEGALKEGVGAILADAQLRQAGATERLTGTVQNAAGSARDSARSAVEKRK